MLLVRWQLLRKYVLRKKLAHPAYLNAYKASFKAATGRDYDTMMAHPEKAKQDKGEAA